MAPGKPFRCKELKKYDIRAARKPQDSPYLSGVVWVADEAGRGVCYVKFSRYLEEDVGAALPYGVSPDKPAFLKLLQFRTRGSWRLYAYYVDLSCGVLLLEYEDKPYWVKNVRRTDNACTT